MPVDTITSREEADRNVSTGHHHSDGTPEERTLHEIERFRVHALEVLEHSLDHLLVSVAQEVLGRELELAPALIDEITSRALRRYEREGPVRLRVASTDVGQVESDLPVVVDSALTPGDLVIEVRDGELDARLPVRLSCIVRRLQSDAARDLASDKRR